MTTLALRGVRKTYGNFDVLSDINISIESGEFLVLLGPSGCGKSTLLHAIAGLHRITGGDILLGGKRINDVPCQDRDIAMVFQSYALYPSMTVEQNIGFPLEMRKVPARERAHAIADVARLLKIEPLLKRRPSQLSGGQRQRVAIGRALVRNPQLFLFDEPLSNLDAMLRVEMRTELKKLHQAIGRTTVYVTHDQIEAMTLASRIAVLNNGILQQLGTPFDVYNSPANLFVATFIGSPAITLVKGTVIPFEGKYQFSSHDNTDGALHFVIPDDVDVAAGQSVTIGLRPEAFVLSSTGQVESNYITRRAEVSLIEPTGPDSIIVFKLAGTEALARVPASEAPDLGGCYVSFSPDTVLFFDTLSERLLTRKRKPTGASHGAQKSASALESTGQV
jgi:multiple sugar transport system ATP-binding protein